MSDDTPIITIAKMVTELAAALDVQAARSEALAAENAALKHAMSVTMEHVSVMDTGQAGVAAMIINDALHNSETPVTDAFLAEIRAQGVEMYAANLDSSADDAERRGFDDAVKFLQSEASAVRLFAAQLRGNSNGGAL
ncbi:hypothetical protein [Atlantibacter sp.]|uniref:hypothetical protein n=1 Tax=Atlantibacter sp. TaxID=1903473 RepID=UPI003917CF94